MSGYLDLPRITATIQVSTLALYQYNGVVGRGVLYVDGIPEVVFQSGIMSGDSAQSRAESEMKDRVHHAIRILTVGWEAYLDEMADTD